MLQAAPRGEIEREEAFNYRLLGPLPVGWQRRGDEFVWVYKREDIAHAFVHFARQRLERDVDTLVALKARTAHYRFPGIPKETVGAVRAVTWGDQKAVEYRLEATLQGTRCLRRVRALCFDRVWYECIETVYGQKTEEDDDGCREGLAAFDTGFRLLVGPLKATKPGAIIKDLVQGYALPHPAAMKRTRPSSVSDPGCRVVLETVDPDPRHRLRVRLFEYGVHERFEPKTWFATFFGAFGNDHEDPKQQTIDGFDPPGATCLLAMRFSGVRDKQPIHTDIYLFRTTRDKTVFALRVRKRGEGGERFAAQIRAVQKGLRLGDAVEE